MRLSAERHPRVSTRLGRLVITVVSTLALLMLVASCGGAQTSATPAAKSEQKTESTSPGTKQATPEKPASSESKPAAQVPASKEPYKVGLVTAFTGTRAETQETTIKAVRLAAEMVNASGGIDGHKVELVEYDNEEDPQKSIPIFKRVIEQDKAVAIIGPGINAAIQAVKPLIKDGPLTVVTSASAKPEPNSYMFQVPVTQPTLQRMLFNYFKKNNYSKVALLATTDATGEDAVKNIGEIAKEVGGIEVAIERYNADDVDVTPQITKIRGDKAIKALVIWSTGKQAATPVKNAAQLGLDIPIQVSMGNHTNNFIKLIKGSEPKLLWIATGRGTAWYDLPDDDPIKPIAKSFAEAYKAKFGDQADLQAFSGYDAAKLIFDALKAAGPDSKKMKEWIESQPMWLGANLEHKYTKDNHEGDLPQGAALVEISGGTWRLVK